MKAITIPMDVQANVKDTTKERPPAGCKYVCRYDVGDGREYLLYRFKDEPEAGLAYRVRNGKWQ